MAPTDKAGKALSVPSVDELAKANSGVDKSLVSEAVSMVQELRDQGIPASTYGIASPYERRQLRRDGAPRVRRMP